GVDRYRTGSGSDRINDSTLIRLLPLGYILMQSLDSKLGGLRETIARLQSCAVAFSGGVDSTLVLKVAHDALGDRVIAVTALSESLPHGELEAAEKLARAIGARHLVIRTFETRDKNYLANAANRCYF